MADAEENAMVIDADAVVDTGSGAADEPTHEIAATIADAGIEQSSEEITAAAEVAAGEGTPVQLVEEKGDNEEVISKVFTAVDQEGAEVQYVTMTQEEAEAAGVEEDDQVVTTSLQFDPANPSVLYTADGTPINQADLSPEEQALVQAALQQHLAEQEAEQQLALIEQTSSEAATMETQASEVPGVGTTTVATSAAIVSQDTVAATAVDVGIDTAGESQLTIAENDPVAVITPATDVIASESSRVDFVSSAPGSSNIVQPLADSAQREQEYEKAQNLIDQASVKADMPEGFKLEEKIVIRQGQPQVVKVPVRTPNTKKPEIPAVLANLMPKVEIGKDGSQVIRIHQSQITADQLKSLQENPNVRLVFRPASSSRGKGSAGIPYQPRKRGRPPKNYVSAYSPALNRGSKAGRYGRPPKTPYYQKDYLGGELENGANDVTSERVYIPGKRGRPLGSGNKVLGYRSAPSFARKLEKLREQEFRHDEELNNARLSIVPQKPVLSGVELAISTRRKNRLRELLSACSEQEVLEVALPHLARVFSLWEFLVMKVEKQKMSRVYFADVYKEYEILHRYVSRLTEKYKEVLMAEKLMKPAVSPENGDTEGSGESMEKEKKNIIKVRCKSLAQSLGLDKDELEDAFVTLLDAEELEPPPPKAAKISTESKEIDLTQSENDASNDDTGEQKELSGLGAFDKLVDNTLSDSNQEKMDTDKSDEVAATEGESTQLVTEGGEGTEAATGGTQIIQIGTGDDKQFIEVPEGYTLIQTPEGLVMSQPGTTLSQAEDGTIYVTHEDGSTSTLDSQKAVPLESFDSLITEEQQQPEEATEEPAQ